MDCKVTFGLPFDEADYTALQLNNCDGDKIYVPIFVLIYLLTAGGVSNFRTAISTVCERDRLKTEGHSNLRVTIQPREVFHYTTCL
jgi:hypothetical protein